jgi:predicted ester cyclase
MTRRRTILFGLGVLTLDRRAAAGGGSMAETQQLKRAATRFYDTLNDALRTGRLDLLDDVLAPEAIDHNPVPGMAPGREGIKKAFAEGRRSFSDMRVTVEDTVAEGDKVACRVVVRMVHSGEFQGIPATGARVTQSGIDILRITGGVVTERWGEFDLLGLLQQLGAVMAPRS